jgi:hypothetical protein
LKANAKSFNVNHTANMRVAVASRACRSPRLDLMRSDVELGSRLMSSRRATEAPSDCQKTVVEHISTSTADNPLELAPAQQTPSALTMRQLIRAVIPVFISFISLAAPAAAGQ